MTKVRDSRKSKINELKKELTKTDEELKKQDMQIEKINAQIKVKQATKMKNDYKKEVSKDELIKELSTLIQKYDGKTVSNVLNEINLS